MLFKLKQNIFKQNCSTYILHLLVTKCNTFLKKIFLTYNSVCESFFGGMKREELYRTNYKSEKQLQQSIKNYIKFYNTKKPHTLLRYRTPDKTETDFLSRQANKRKKDLDTNGSNT